MSHLAWLPAGPVCSGIVGRLNLVVLVATLATAGLSRGASAQEAAADESRSSQLPQLISAVNPTYPDSLKDLGIEGTVILQAAIDTSGQVDRSTVKVVRDAQGFALYFSRAPIPHGRDTPAVSLDDIKKFRQLYSKTPGHPEYRHTSGVDTTTASTP